MHEAFINHGQFVLPASLGPPACLAGYGFCVADIQHFVMILGAVTLSSVNTLSSVMHVLVRHPRGASGNVPYIVY